MPIMRMGGSAVLKRKRYVIEFTAVALLMLLGAAVRLWDLGAVPFGLNQDEASAGYEAWAILNYGIDRCGNAWPVLLESWGSGQNALYTYLAMPFISALGLNELSLRLPMAIFGVLTLAVFWRMARRCRGPAFGVCALFFLAVNPWHVMISRWALESNLMPFWLLIGVWLLTEADERPWTAAVAGAAFAVSLYAYGTAFFFIPLYVLLMLPYLRKKSYRAPLLAGAAIFIIMAFPITVCQALNVLGLGRAKLFGLTLPALTESRQASTSILGGGGIGAAFDNFRSCLRIMWTQSDGLPFNFASCGGLYYFFGLPLAALGLAVSLGQRRDFKEEAPVRNALFSGIVASFFIDPNINRINMIWLPVIYASALGAFVILKRLKKWSVLPAAGMLVCAALFINSYVSDMSKPGNEFYYPGLGEAIEYADALGTDSVYVTDRVNQPYIFVLFYTETPPDEFIRSVDYINPDGAFRYVRSFGRWRFGGAEDACGDCLILHRSEVGDRIPEAYFGSYAVCIERY